MKKDIRCGLEALGEQVADLHRQIAETIKLIDEGHSHSCVSASFERIKVAIISNAKAIGGIDNALVATAPEVLFDVSESPDAA